MVTDGLNPFTLLLFIGAVLGGGALLTADVCARLTGRETLAKGSRILGASGVGAYVLLFVIASVTSSDRVLAPGEAKHVFGDMTAFRSHAEA